MKNWRWKDSVQKKQARGEERNGSNWSSTSIRKSKQKLWFGSKSQELQKAPENQGDKKGLGLAWFKGEPPISSPSDLFFADSAVTG